jgi:hypothetical protein
MCAIYGEHRCSTDLHTPGSTSGNSLFTVKSGLYTAFDLFVDALYSTLLIAAADFFRLLLLNRILLSHQYAQHGRYPLKVEDLTCSRHRFSEVHHQALHMFVRPKIFRSRDVSDCTILCYDPAVIPMTALLHASRFLFTEEAV